MKKLLIIASVGLFFASCTKDRTCTCSVGGTTVSTVVMKKVTKSIAKSRCINRDYQGTLGTTSVNCTLS